MADAPPVHTTSPSLAEPGSNCWKVAKADRLAVIVDACDYFRIVRRAMLEAEQRIMIVGWDFDTRIDLDPDDDDAMDLGHFMLHLAKQRPDLEIRILKWDFGAWKSLFRGSHLWMLFRWAMTRAIRFKFDAKHPPGCSHHQKIVVIDNCLAVCGGIDMTSDRWDTRDHKDDDPRRVEPNGKTYGPWHDATALLNGAAAAALGELCRDRWKIATGETMQPAQGRNDCWVEDVEPHFRDAEVALSRTRAAYEDEPEVREIEQLYLDMIASAERFIYAENQYFTSPKIAAAIADRLQENPELEIVMVQPLTAEGWIEQVAMDGTRVRITRMIGKSDPDDRFRIYYPLTEGGTPIYVHAKLMIIDDRVLRIGSSNMNNRSLGLDSECDVMIEASQAESVDAARKSIQGIREGLLAEHLGISCQDVRDSIERTGSMRAAIAEFSHDGRRLEPIPMEEPEGFEKFVADKELLDPECADEMFEPLSKRGLVRSFWANLRGKPRSRR